MNNGNHDALKQAEGNEELLRIVEAIIFVGIRRPFENLLLHEFSNIGTTLPHERKPLPRN